MVAEGPCDLAVAFWGADAADFLGLPEDASGYRIVCDAFSGACNPKTIKDLLHRGASVVDVEGIHAKVYVGRSCMVVCSANASANGLGEEDGDIDPGLEAGVLLHSPEAVGEARTWFEASLNRGTAVTTKDLKEISEAWKARHSDRPTRRRKAKLIDLLLGDAAWFADRRLRVVLYDGEEPPKSVKAAYRASPFHAKRPKDETEEYPFYWSTESWKVTAGDLILDLAMEDGELTCGGVWQVEGKIAQGSITAVRLLKRPLGLSFPERDWPRLAKKVAKAGIADRVAKGELLDASRFARSVAGR